MKIRGHRVELGDVEAAPPRQPAIHGAVVLAHADPRCGSQQLSAFVVPRGGGDARPCSPPSRPPCARNCPTTCCPAAICRWTACRPRSTARSTARPLRRHLDEQCQERLDEQRFGTPGELQVAPSRQEVLGHTDFGLDDSFFEVGGHSPLAAALVRELSRRFGNRAYIHDIYRTPSVRQLAASLARRAGEAPPALDSEPAQELQRTCACPPTWISAAPWTPPTARATAHPAHRRQRADGRPPARRAAGQPRGRPALSGPCAKRRPCPRTPAPGRPAAPHRTRRDGLATGQAYAADLAEPGFGLPAETYRELAGSVDQVFHSASAVNFIQPYSYMKRDNVEGLGQVLRFCASGRCKPLMLLSSISVYSWGHLHTGKRLMREDDDIDQNLPAVVTDMGYVRSKWVMEKIADLAAERGLPLMTFRPATPPPQPYRRLRRLPVVEPAGADLPGVPGRAAPARAARGPDHGGLHGRGDQRHRPPAFGAGQEIQPGAEHSALPDPDEFFDRLGRRAGRPSGRCRSTTG